MIIIFICLLFVITSFSLFGITMRIQGINRLIVNVPKEIFEYAVIDNKGYIEYDMETVKSRYITYIEQGIHHYTDNYDIYFRFYYPFSGGLCDEHCEGVEVYIKADIVFSYEYKRVMFYEIRRING